MGGTIGVIKRCISNSTTEPIISGICLGPRKKLGLQENHGLVCGSTYGT